MAHGKCSVDGCGRVENLKRGWCERCYKRWQRHGDPLGALDSQDDADLAGEIWRAVLAFEGLYEVSSLWRVRSLPRILSDGRRWQGGILKPDRSDRGGYLRYMLIGTDSKKVHRPVHQLVCEAWHGPRPDGLQVRHLDGRPTNNAPGNLKWGTASENALDRSRHGHWISNSKFVNATHCIHGHEFTEKNTYWRPSGGRDCYQCRADNNKRRQEAKRSAQQPV